jgi:hypothetical protein
MTVVARLAPAPGLCNQHRTMRFDVAGARAARTFASHENVHALAAHLPAPCTNVRGSGAQERTHG